ncbi:aminotransferase class V-fold PLP-dependent enzyme [Streptomyces decoyicus]|uniref:aminotransferase class V-fold PLP-dependent enzyme n=1 Tax=Streptomyces decoyicus TaxID=249567 RepID=UPI00345D3AEA
MTATRRRESAVPSEPEASPEAMSQPEFRAQFPALRNITWLDTPGSPPGAEPVNRALGSVLSDWRSGEFDWLDWDDAAARCRSLFAGYLGVPVSSVAAMASVAEAAATVAATLEPGRIVVPACEFRSNLLPWLQLDPARYEVVTVPARDGAVRTEDLVAALDDRTVLLAVSEVLSRDGVRADLPALRAATDAVGARLFVDATQSLGALRLDMSALRPDYLAVHGYKWMVAPRGAAWLVVRPDRLCDLAPLMPSWKSSRAPHTYFGGRLDPAPGAARCDTSPAWFSWLGACAAVGLMSGLDATAVEQHCLALADEFLTEARAMGISRAASGPQSHIAVVRTDDAARMAKELAARRIRATALADRLRVGFHYFNDRADVAAVLTAIRRALRQA